MSVEAPNRQETIELDVQLRNEFGFEPIHGYRASFFQEKGPRGVIFDHMLLISDENPNNPVGIFKLKRSKFLSVDKYLEKESESSEDALPGLDTFQEMEADRSINEVKNEFESKGIKPEPLSALFYKWQGRIHSFIVDEKGEVIGAYRVNPQRTPTTASKYFTNWEPQEDAFEQNQAYYDGVDDSHHP